uniref:ubiquitinyl hydrolase 1 n=1 Tax=Albugo laibachii Nc14 TaxID=890382 RepID=F0WET2_9STRA|nr:conserved hypothetical protein [Albugo laibachii Nc14]|eukprot:CCA19714.1 conserved hypothetical protein [Albugo laibachii Nc14]
MKMESKAPLSATKLAELDRLLWPNQVNAEAQNEDYTRWYQQGLVYTAEILESAARNDIFFSLGLLQTHGGPCGVLAAVQAEILCSFLFLQRANSDSVSQEEALVSLSSTFSSESRQKLLVSALTSILGRCAKESATATIQIAVPDQCGGNTIAVISLPAETAQSVLSSHIQVFTAPRGVVHFIYSVILTKGIEQIRREMDDPQSTLTGTYGHCTQELVNLLLTGKATSNVFDGSIPLGDSGMSLRGVSERARIGYLTQLEALRYCEVGSYYKCPRYPIWVVGSSSHFTILFGLDESICNASESQILFERIRRTFQSFDSMETGFVDVTKLPNLLETLHVPEAIRKDMVAMSRLQNRLELAGAGIIVWDEFWKVISVLMHTGDLNKALDDTSSSTTPRERSDSQLARELQAQFDAGINGAIEESFPVAESAPEEVATVASSFQLYHYNGWKTDSNTNSTGLNECTVKFDLVQDFIGQAVPLKHQSMVHCGKPGESALDGVIRTRWSTASVEWTNGQVPRID